MQRVLAGLVGEKCDRLAVGRPRRIALGDPGGAREIADVALFGGHAEDFSARFKDGASAGGRNRGVFNLVADFFVVRTRCGKIAGNVDVDFCRFAAAGIERENFAELFVDERVGSGRERFEVEALVFDCLLHGFGFCVVGEKRDGTVAIGEKINRVAKPHRFVVIGIFARNFFEFQTIELNDVDRRGLAAFVTLPRGLPFQIRNVRDALRVGRERSRLAAPHRENFGPAALDGNSVETIKIGVGLARGIEEHALTVGRPAADDIRPGMPGETSRRAAFGGHHECVNVAVVRAGEGDPFSVGRKNGRRFVAAGGELARFTAFARDAPEVASVDEDDLGFAERWRVDEQRLIRGG